MMYFFSFPQSFLRYNQSSDFFVCRRRRIVHTLLESPSFESWARVAVGLSKFAVRVGSTSVIQSNCQSIFSLLPSIYLHRTSCWRQESHIECPSSPNLYTTILSQILIHLSFFFPHSPQHHRVRILKSFTIIGDFEMLHEISNPVAVCHEDSLLCELLPYYLWWWLQSEDVYYSRRKKVGCTLLGAWRSGACSCSLTAHSTCTLCNVVLGGEPPVRSVCGCRVIMLLLCQWATKIRRGLLWVNPCLPFWDHR